MSEYGVATEPGTVRLERVLPGPIERVWKYLTDSDLRAKWLASGDMDLQVGGRRNCAFATPSFRAGGADARALPAYEGVSFPGRITRCDPPNVLSYTWGEAWGEDSEVTFELAARGAEVVMVLTHRRLPDLGAR